VLATTFIQANYRRACLADLYWLAACFWTKPFGSQLEAVRKSPCKNYSFTNRRIREVNSQLEHAYCPHACPTSSQRSTGLNINNLSFKLNQYSQTNVMHFLFNLSINKGLYMFRALLAHLQETLHKRLLIYCVRVMSVGCYQDCSRIAFHSNAGSSQLT
jgi:hypothetical protein